MGTYINIFVVIKQNGEWTRKLVASRRISGLSKEVFDYVSVLTEKSKKGIPEDVTPSLPLLLTVHNECYWASYEDLLQLDIQKVEDFYVEAGEEKVFLFKFLEELSTKHGSGNVGVIHYYS